MLVPLVDMLNHAGKAPASGWTVCFSRLACIVVCCLLLACPLSGRRGEPPAAAGLVDAAAVGSELLLDIWRQVAHFRCLRHACKIFLIP